MNTGRCATVFLLLGVFFVLGGGQPVSAQQLTGGLETGVTPTAVQTVPVSGFTSQKSLSPDDAAAAADGKNPTCEEYKKKYDAALAQRKTPPLAPACSEKTSLGPVPGHCVIGSARCKGEKTVEGKDPKLPDDWGKTPNPDAYKGWDGAQPLKDGQQYYLDPKTGQIQDLTKLDPLSPNNSLYNSPYNSLENYNFPSSYTGITPGQSVLDSTFNNFFGGDSFSSGSFLSNSPAGSLPTDVVFNPTSIADNPNFGLQGGTSYTSDLYNTQSLAQTPQNLTGGYSPSYDPTPVQTLPVTGFSNDVPVLAGPYQSAPATLQTPGLGQGVQPILQTNPYVPSGNIPITNLQTVPNPWLNPNTAALPSPTSPLAGWQAFNPTPVANWPQTNPYNALATNPTTNLSGFCQQNPAACGLSSPAATFGSPTTPSGSTPDALALLGNLGAEPAGSQAPVSGNPIADDFAALEKAGLLTPTGEPGPTPAAQGKPFFDPTSWAQPDQAGDKTSPYGLGGLAGANWVTGCKDLLCAVPLEQAVYPFAPSDQVIAAQEAARANALALAGDQPSAPPLTRGFTSVPVPNSPSDQTTGFNADELNYAAGGNPFDLSPEAKQAMDQAAKANGIYTYSPDTPSSPATLGSSGAAKLIAPDATPQQQAATGGLLDKMGADKKFLSSYCSTCSYRRGEIVYPDNATINAGALQDYQAEANAIAAKYYPSSLDSKTVNSLGATPGVAPTTASANPSIVTPVAPRAEPVDWGAISAAYEGNAAVSAQQNADLADKNTLDNLAIEPPAGQQQLSNQNLWETWKQNAGSMYKNATEYVGGLFSGSPQAPAAPDSSVKQSSDLATQQALNDFAAGYEGNAAISAQQNADLANSTQQLSLDTPASQVRGTYAVGDSLTVRSGSDGLTIVNNGTEAFIPKEQLGNQPVGKVIAEVQAADFASSQSAGQTPPAQSIPTADQRLAALAEQQALNNFAAGYERGAAISAQQNADLSTQQAQYDRAIKDFSAGYEGSVAASAQQNADLSTQQAQYEQAMKDFSAGYERGASISAQQNADLATRQAQYEQALKDFVAGYEGSAAVSAQQNAALTEQQTLNDIAAGYEGGAAISAQQNAELATQSRYDQAVKDFSAGWEGSWAQSAQQNAELATQSRYDQAVKDFSAGWEGAWADSTKQSAALTEQQALNDFAAGYEGGASISAQQNADLTEQQALNDFAAGYEQNAAISAGQNADLASNVASRTTEPVTVKFGDNSVLLNPDGSATARIPLSDGRTYEQTFTPQTAQILSTSEMMQEAQANLSADVPKDQARLASAPLTYDTTASDPYTASGNEAEWRRIAAQENAASYPVSSEKLAEVVKSAAATPSDGLGTYNGDYTGAPTQPPTADIDTKSAAELKAIQDQIYADRVAQAPGPGPAPSLGEQVKNWWDSIWSSPTAQQSATPDQAGYDQAVNDFAAGYEGSAAASAQQNAALTEQQALNNFATGYEGGAAISAQQNADLAKEQLAGFSAGWEGSWAQSAQQNADLTEQQALNDFAAGYEQNAAISAGQNADLTQVAGSQYGPEPTDAFGFTAEPAGEQPVQALGPVQGTKTSIYGKGFEEAGGSPNQSLAYTTGTRGENPYGFALTTDEQKRLGLSPGDKALIFMTDPKTGDTRSVVATLDDHKPTNAAVPADLNSPVALGVGCTGGHCDIGIMRVTPGAKTGPVSWDTAQTYFNEPEPTTQVANTSGGKFLSSDVANIGDSASTENVPLPTPRPDIPQTSSVTQTAPTVTQTFSAIAQKLDSGQAVTAADVRSFVTAANSRSIPTAQRADAIYYANIAKNYPGGYLAAATAINGSNLIKSRIQTTLRAILGR